MVFKFSSVLLVLLFFHFLVAFRLQASEAQSWIKAAYWFYGSEFPIADINSALFTHFIYAFAGLNSLSYELSLTSDSEEQDQEQHYSTFSSTVKQKNPSVTTLISIGGGNADYSVFSTLVSNSSHRKTFIDSSIKIARLYGFQGLDLCWVSASTSSDMTNMGNLFQEWRAAVKSEAANSSQAQLILTAAVQYKPDLESFSFPVESIRNNLNWVHVMAYDYYGPQWTNFTGAHAALYDPSSDASTDYGIKAWLGKGLSASKLVLGLPFYGYAWKLVNPRDNGIGAPATGPAITEDGSMSYKDIKGYIQRYGADIIYNATYVVKYCIIGSSWIGFDDAQVVKIKVSYAKEQSLLGYFVWQVSHDDNWVLSLAAAATAQESASSGPKKRRLLIIILTTAASVILILGSVMCYFRMRMLKSKVKESESRENYIADTAGTFNSNVPNLQVFGIAVIEVATEGFSIENKLGEGGYGPVYKGVLPNGQEIAVKKLSEASTQGFEEFKNEVMLTAKLQHVNLVRVLGFCIEHHEQMLIYDYMPKKSLDLYLFDPIRRYQLDWRKRVSIIEGVTQGLLYLQEYSRLTIIHRDLKASNILLDEEMRPKISDFGMARIFTKDEQEANTSRIVGTYCLLTMSSGDDSKVPSSQVSLYLWGGSLVHNKRFVANLHRVTTEAQFQKWRAVYASAIPDDVQVKLVKYRADDTPRADASDPNARIITFRPFYFSLGFTFPLSRLFKEVFCAMECAPSQCTPNVYRAIKCFENLSRFFTLELTVREFFYFFQVRRFEDYAQVRIYKAKLFDSLSQGDHAWHDDVLEVSGRWEGDVGDGPLVPITYCNASSISKQLKLGPDMAKVRRALSIPPKFREWRWLLSEYREEDGGLPPAKDVEKWKENGPDPLDLLVGQEECSAESLSKRKVAATSSRHEATSSRAKDDASPLRKKPRLPSAEKTQARSAPSSSARVEKTQAGSVPSSSAKVKHLVSADSRKVGENHDLLREVVRARSRSTERQRDADIPHRSSSRPHQSKDGVRSGRSAHDPVVETRAAKRGVDSTSLTSLQARLAEAKKMRESSARAKGSSSVSAVDPKVNKSSPAGDAHVSDLLKTNFLSNPSSCAELVDHIRQAGDLGTFSSLSLENQREVAFHLLQKGLIFAAQTVQNSSAVAPSSAQLSELEKKNVELASKLSAEQARCEKKTSDLRAMISELKSSLAEKDSELNSSAADLVSRKDAFFRLERKNADISLSYEKLLARFRAHHESAERSKSEATIDAYKLGYLHCADGIASLYAIEDADIETLCPDIFRVQGEAEEQAAGAERAEEDEMMADVAEQAGEAAEGMADHADAEEAADQGPPAGVSE